MGVNASGSIGIARAPTTKREARITEEKGIIGLTESHGRLASAVAEDAAPAKVEDWRFLPPEVNEPLEQVFSRLADKVGRPRSDLLAQARRLSDTHWVSTVGDLLEYGSRRNEWRRLDLPLKLEFVLREHLIEGKMPSSKKKK